MNILPAFKTVASLATENKALKWFPKASLSSKTDLTYLDTEAIDSKRKPARQAEPVKDQPPNERYNVDNYSPEDPSPIGSSSRGEADPVEIVLPVDLLRESKVPKPPTDDEKDLTLGVYNMFVDMPLELYVRKGSSSMLSVSVEPGRYVTKLIRTKILKRDAPGETRENTLTCAFCPTDSAVIQLPSSKVMHTFRFQQGPIGLELEDADSHVMCRRVIPSSQAWEHQKALTGSEIIAVNNIRITTLDDFYELLAENRVGGVTLRAIVTVSTSAIITSKIETVNNMLIAEKGAVAEIASDLRGTENTLPHTESEKNKLASQVSSTYHQDGDDNLIATVRVKKSDGDGMGVVPWSYITGCDAPEDEKEELSMHLTCMPIEALQRSKRWGHPTSLLQVSNMSAEWRLDIYWVDEEGVLIFRKTLNTGDRHAEMTSRHHLWALRAAALADTAEDGVKLPFPPSSDNIILIRPCASSLHKDRCTSVLWVPLRSLTVSQRETHPFQQLSKAKVEFKLGTSEPVMHIQIF